MRADCITSSMQKLFTSMSKPVLTDIEMVITGVEDVEMYPFPCPDLFCGQPAMVSGASPNHNLRSMHGFVAAGFAVLRIAHCV